MALIHVFENLRKSCVGVLWCRCCVHSHAAGYRGGATCSAQEERYDTASSLLLSHTTHLPFVYAGRLSEELCCFLFVQLLEVSCSESLVFSLVSGGTAFAKVCVRLYTCPLCIVLVCLITGLSLFAQARHYSQVPLLCSFPNCIDVGIVTTIARHSWVLTACVVLFRDLKPENILLCSKMQHRVSGAAPDGIPTPRSLCPAPGPAELKRALTLVAQGCGCECQEWGCCSAPHPTVASVESGDGNSGGRELATRCSDKGSRRSSGSSGSGSGQRSGGPWRVLALDCSCSCDLDSEARGVWGEVVPTVGNCAEGADVWRWVVKISDFGMSRIVGEGSFMTTMVRGSSAVCSCCSHHCTQDTFVTFANYPNFCSMLVLHTSVFVLSPNLMHRVLCIFYMLNPHGTSCLVPVPGWDPNVYCSRGAVCPTGHYANRIWSCCGYGVVLV